MRVWTWAAVGLSMLAVHAGCEFFESNSPGTGGSGGGGTCADATECTTCDDRPSCVACCDEANPTARPILSTELILTCICDANGPCAKACVDDMTVCTDPTVQVTTGCKACMDGLIDSTPCVLTAEDHCSQDPDCSPILQCRAGCPQ